MLWFDVGVKRYTTRPLNILTTRRLWFDVGVKRYTTDRFQRRGLLRCGLM